MNTTRKHAVRFGLLGLLALVSPACGGADDPPIPNCAAVESGCMGQRCETGGCIEGLVCDLGVCKKFPSDGDAETEAEP